MPSPQVKKLAWWITEREAIRRKKDAGASKPWTQDKLLQQFKFTNVHREDDRVTRWIKKHWRDPHDVNPHMWHAMIVARFINNPDTLEQTGWPEPWNKKCLKVAKALRLRRDTGQKVYSGAYIVSTNGVPMDKVEYSIQLFDAAWRHGFVNNGLLADAHKQLMQINGLGSFMAAQVVADLKHTAALQHAADWWDWAAPGPGSLRGLKAVRGGSVADYSKPTIFIQELKKLRDEVTPLLVDVRRLCLQDLQNCLCEFSKYIRGYSRSRYPGEA